MLDKEIMDLEKSDFRKIFVADICQQAGFGGLMTFGTRGMTDDERRLIAERVAHYGLTPPVTDEDFENMAHAVSARTFGKDGNAWKQ